MSCAFALVLKLKLTTQKLIEVEDPFWNIDQQYKQAIDLDKYQRESKKKIRLSRRNNTLG